MAKLKLNPDPTFKVKVEVPVPAGTADVEFVFKYRDGKSIKAWIEQTQEHSDVECILDCATGWNLDDEFSAENVERLCNSYPGSARAVIGRYLRELAGIREGN